MKGLDYELPRPRIFVISSGNLVVLRNTGVFVLLFTSKTMKVSQQVKPSHDITRGKTTRYSWLWVKMCKQNYENALSLEKSWVVYTG
jgi:hypothetical protein